MIIKDVRAIKIKDSRGEETIEVSVKGCKASSPSGKSTGKYETKPWHENIDWNVKFLNASYFNIEIKEFADLKKIEIFIKRKLKLKNVKEFGANALFSLESAILKALAKSERKKLWEIINSRARKLPIPVGNVVGGGLHSHNKSHQEFQEFLLIPKGKSFRENYKIMKEVYGKIGKILKAKGKDDEGAWETNLGNEKIFEILSRFKEANIGVDVASSSFYKNGNYYYKNKKLTRKEQIEYVSYLTKKHNLFYVEDPLQEEDFSGFAMIKRSRKHLIVGDDLTATQILRVKKAIRKKSINAMIIKPNQNGSLIELKKIFEICRKNGIKTILSHRSGETLDSALADYAIGFGADFIKTGISTKWREVKLGRLGEIEKTN